MGSLNFGSFNNYCYGEDNGHLPKRSRFEASTNQPVLNLSPFSPEKRLEEQSPLGLKLRRTPSFLEFIQTKLAQRNCGSSGNNNPSTVIAADEGRGKNDKPKASNFQASLLRIGSWEYNSKYEGDLLAKCYFAKHKLVWEFIEGGLKSKIEMEWSDITGLNAEFSDDDSGTLTVVLARKPSFFRETNPLPRKHTLWEQITDFTNGQASTHRQHILHCPPRTLSKHYEKILECDMRLRILSQQKLVVDSPYFEVASTINEGKGNDINECMVSEQIMANSGSFLPPSKCHDDMMLQNISQMLLNEDPVDWDDEWSLKKKENSFNNILLGLEPDHNVDQVEVEVPAQNIYNYDHLFNDYDSTTYDQDENMMMQQQLQAPGGGVVNFEDDYGRMHAPASLSREDSFSDLLLHLPRIDSLPKIFDDLVENAEANDRVNDIIIIDDD